MVLVGTSPDGGGQEDTGNDEITNKTGRDQILTADEAVESALHNIFMELKLNNMYLSEMNNMEIKRTDVE